LIETLIQKRYYYNWKVCGDNKIPLKIEIKDKVKSKPDAIFCCVGPRNFIDLIKSMELEDKTIPIICLENDYDLPEKAQKYIENPIYFGIPDVIASNTASKDLLEMDSLSSITEAGILYLDDKLKNLDGDVIYLPKQELYEQ
jgi:hypothetical protein